MPNAIRHLAFAFFFSLSSCRALMSPMPDVGVDLGQVADELALYRADVEDVATLYPPEMQVQLLAIASQMASVEDALRRGDQAAAKSIAEAALVAAEELLKVVDPNGKAAVYLVLAKVGLRHLKLGEFDQVGPSGAPEPKLSEPPSC